MNLLNYTKKLYEKIKFYDDILKHSNYDQSLQNPFSFQEPLNITVIWLQEDET